MSSWRRLVGILGTALISVTVVGVGSEWLSRKLWAGGACSIQYAATPRRAAAQLEQRYWFLGMHCTQSNGELTCRWRSVVRWVCCARIENGRIGGACGSG